MPRLHLGSHLRSCALLCALVVALVTSCGSGNGDRGAPTPPPPPPLPEGGQLLGESAEAMSRVQTMRFEITVNGEVPEIPFTTAEGQLTKAGDAKGTGALKQAGQIIEVEFVIVGDTLYLRGPTGGFQELPASAAGMVYDPSVILDDERGVPHVLTRAREATTEERDKATGVPSYRIEATFPAGALSRLVPGYDDQVTGLLWVAEADSRLIQARFPAPGGSVLVRFFDFDAAADITAPS